MAESAIHRSMALRIEGLCEARLVQIAFYARSGSGSAGHLPIPAGLTADGCFTFSPAPGRVMLYSPVSSGWSGTADAVPPHFGCVTELSHSRSAYVVSGSGAERFLASLFAIDFSTASFPIGKGIATVHHEAPVYLIRAAADAFHCLVARSFGRDFETVMRNVAKGWDDARAADLQPR
ncbi:hypothetical protein [Shinella sp. BYT-45]|uniref:hypothetical protein n=1 Tax=Shinella sp. BYT-45 TaxID=3377377 RepID=UPI00398091AF